MAYEISSIEGTLVAIVVVILPRVNAINQYLFTILYWNLSRAPSTTVLCVTMIPVERLSPHRIQKWCATLSAPQR